MLVLAAEETGQPSQTETDMFLHRQRNVKVNRCPVAEGILPFLNAGGASLAQRAASDLRIAMSSDFDPRAPQTPAR